MSITTPLVHLVKRLFMKHHTVERARYNVILHALIILACTIVFCLIPTKSVHGESDKDSAQDQHMVYIDKQIQDVIDSHKETAAKLDTQIAELTALNADLNRRLYGDEELLRGGLAVIGILQAFGLVKNWKASKPD